MATRKSRPSRRGGNTSATQPWWEQAEEVPRGGLPDAEQLNRRARRYRRLIQATLVLFPITLLVLLVSLGNPAANNTSQGDEYAKTRPVALAAVRDWLAGDPTPLPGGEVVAWEGATTREVEPDPNRPDQVAYRSETHTIAVSAPGDRMFEVTLTLAAAPTYGINVISTPSLIPKEPGTDGWKDTSVWPDAEHTTVPADLDPAIRAWADAYTSGDPTKLRLVLGDERSDHAYLPLAGVEFTDLRPRDAAIHPAGLIVSVEVDAQWAGTAPADGSSRAAAPLAYDLLITGHTTAAPKVVAWGGPGTGPDLEPFANAIEGRSFSAADPDTTPTPEHGPDPVSGGGEEQQP